LIIAKRKDSKKDFRNHVTLHDVARASGFAASTVSIVLNNAPLSRNVAVSTRKHIREIAQSLGYHPDAFARSLRRNRSRMIGVITYDLSDPFCISIIHGIEDHLQSQGYLPQFMDSRSQRSLFEAHLRMALERRAEGIIVIASWVFDENSLLADVEKNHVPAVVIGREMTARHISSVLVDNDAGGYLALQHLHQLGHRKVAVVRGPEELFDSQPRWEGVQRYAAEANLKLNPALICQLPGQVNPYSAYDNGIRLTERLLATKQEFSAVLAFDDLTALGVIRGLHQSGLQVPKDCSVIGFDDVFPMAISLPSVTTIRQPMVQIGETAAQCVMRALKAKEDGKESPVQVHTLAPTLIARESTAPCRTGPEGGKGKP
jgi:DNA-binding LacI/PurR family transcriptional regulator